MMGEPMRAWLAEQAPENVSFELGGRYALAY
jgi:hypothetical protein